MESKLTALEKIKKSIADGQPDFAAIDAIAFHHPELISEEYLELKDQAIKMIALVILQESQKIFIGIQLENDVISQLKNVDRAFRSAVDYQITAEILAKKNLDERTLVFDRWVSVMRECYNRGDINSAHAISAALNNKALHRLKATREGLTRESKALLHEFDQLTITPEARRALNLRDETFVPYIGDYTARFATSAESKSKKETTAGENKLISELKEKQQHLLKNPVKEQKEILALQKIFSEKIAAISKEQTTSGQDFDNKMGNENFTSSQQLVAKDNSPPSLILKKIKIIAIKNIMPTQKLKLIFDNVLKDDAQIAKIKAENITADFIRMLEDKLLKIADLKLLEEVGFQIKGLQIKFDDLNELQKQKYYRKQMEQDLVELIGDQKIEATKDHLAPHMNTQTKVLDLVRYAHQCYLPSYTADEFIKKLAGLNLKVDPDAVKKFWEARKQNQASIKPLKRKT